MKRMKVLAFSFLSGVLMVPSVVATAAPYWTYTDWSCSNYYTDIPTWAGVQALQNWNPPVINSYIDQAVTPPICKQ